MARVPMALGWSKRFRQPHTDVTLVWPVAQPGVWVMAVTRVGARPEFTTNKPAKDCDARTFFKRTAEQLEVSR